MADFISSTRAKRRNNKKNRNPLKSLVGKKTMAGGVAEFLGHFEKRKCLKSLAAKKQWLEV